MDINTFLLQGGLDLVTAPVAMPPGRVTAALNYEPDVAGYRRFAGFERYDGNDAPSDAPDEATATARRADIQAVPGSGPVRGVWVYDGDLYAFRNSTDGGQAKMYVASAAGWIEQSFGYVLTYNAGSSEFTEGQIVTGATSAATALITRFVHQSGTFAMPDVDGTGYLVLADPSGTFTFGEIITDGIGGSATVVAAQTAVTIPAGGYYEFANHNFYGAAKHPRMYFANGVGTAFEYDTDGWLAPIQSGNAVGTVDDVTYVYHRGSDGILTRDGSSIITRGLYDRPTYLAVFRNHLFLGYAIGSVIYSGLGEPLDYRALVGAGEISFGTPITGFLPSASTSFVIFGSNRIEYVTGNNSSDFVMVPVTDNAGARSHTAVMAGDKPVYLDDGGVRTLSTTEAFGDWRLGTITRLIEPLIKAKRDAGIAPVMAMRVKDKDLYRLFFDDQTFISVYWGRKSPECMPLVLPIQVFCGCAGELTDSQGERCFVGAEDGYVYELDKGTSFDGDEMQFYVRLPWNTSGSGAQNKRFHKIRFEVDAPEDIELGVMCHVDYGVTGNPGLTRTNVAIAAGSQTLITPEDYDTIDWSQAMQGYLEAEPNAIGSNIAATIVGEHTLEDPHTLSSATIFSSPRGIKKKVGA